jgi:acyl carrier protein
MAIEKVSSEGKMVGGNHVCAQVRQFILKKFPLARKQDLKNSDALLESGIVDSLGVLDLVNFIEEEFSINVEDEELTPENFQTIDRLTAFVETKASRSS